MWRQAAEAAPGNRAEHIASAKFTAPEIAERLDAAAKQLDHAVDPDLQLLAGLAREQAEQQRSAADLPADVKKGAAARRWHGRTRPRNPVPSEQPLTLTLHIAQPKTVSAVRLHYRATDPAATTQVLEQAAKAEVSFTIPAREITGNWDLQYYFEILHADGNGVV